MSVFVDRVDAGRRLAATLGQMKFEDLVVLALPRGGVPVAAEIASALHLPLDVLFVRKICLPWQPELSVGAVVDGAHPQMVLNEAVLAQVPVPEEYLARERDRELAEIERRRALYCGNRKAVDVAGRDALVVDDGVATGTTVRAALTALRRGGAKRLILATPVIAARTARELRGEGVEVVALLDPDDFRAVGQFYQDFHQLEDEEVVRILESTTGKGHSG